MKAKVKMILPGYTGNMDDVVIYYNSQLNKYIARTKVMPKYTPSNQITKDMYSFAKRIGLSAEFKKDCDTYIRAYNAKNRRKGLALTSWSAVWMKIVRAQVKENPELDFTTLTRETVLSQNLSMRSIATAVEAGYLEKVKGWNLLVSEI